MAEPMKIINNPSITPNVFEYDEAGRVSAISGYTLAGGGGGTIVKSDLMWKPTVGDNGYVSWTLASSATQPAPAYISGAQGPAGPQGVSGNPGKNPELQINSTNAHWEWKYSGDGKWTDLGVVASGAVGPQGLSGNSGKDGISPTVSTSAIPGGNRVTFTYGEGSSTYIDVMSGASGANGKDGISPTVSTETIAGGNRVTFTYGEGSTKSIDVMSGVSGANGSDGFSPVVTITDAPTAAQHPQGGKTVTITDAAHPGGQSFDIWNGINGEGATVNLLDGNGIHITNDGTNYTIAVSADYAAKSYVDSASAYALSQAETWVGNHHYLVANDIAGKADKTDLQYVSAGVDYVSAHIPSLNGYATEQYVQGASAEVTAWVNGQGYLKSVPDYYITETELADYNYVTTATTNSLSSEIEEISSTLNDKYTLSAGTGIYFYEDSINKTTRIDCTVTAATTVAQLTDSGNYYKKSETSGATELSTEFSKYIQTISTGVGLSGDGKTTQLGIDTTVSINLTNASAKSAVSADKTESAKSAKWLRDGDDKVSVGDVTALQNWASSNSSTWDSVTAKLTTAQYATDSATFVTSSNASISAAGEQYALTTTGWAKVQAGSTFTGVTTDVTLTGTGTDASHKLGVAWSALSGNKIDSAKSANSAEYITNGVGYSGFNDISAKFDSLTSYVPFSATVLPIGTNNTATTNAAAIGGLNSAVDLSFALGNANTAKTTGCAIGEHNFAYNKSVAIGYQNTADYNVDIAIGYQCSAHDHGAAFINLCTASDQSIAAGNKCFASAGSVAFGNCTSAYDNSIALGHGSDSNYNIANKYSFLAGDACSAFSYSQAFGRGVVASGNPAGTGIGLFAIGGWNATTANALFVIGNGSWDSDIGKRDALVVHNDGTVSAKQFQNADGTDTINGTTYNFTGVDNIEILPLAATAVTANFPNDNVLRFILES